MLFIFEILFMIEKGGKMGVGNGDITELLNNRNKRGDLYGLRMILNYEISSYYIIYYIVMYLYMFY